MLQSKHACRATVFTGQRARCPVPAVPNRATRPTHVGLHTDLLPRILTLWIPAEQTTSAASCTFYSLADGAAAGTAGPRDVGERRLGRRSWLTLRIERAPWTDEPLTGCGPPGSWHSARAVNTVFEARVRRALALLCVALWARGRRPPREGSGATGAAPIL